MPSEHKLGLSKDTEVMSDPDDKECMLIKSEATEDEQCHSNRRKGVAYSMGHDSTSKVTCTARCSAWFHNKGNIIYFSHSLSAWGDRMWSFAVGLFLIYFNKDSLLMVSIFGLCAGVAALFGGPLVGNWIDNTGRLRAARIALFSQNTLVAICAAGISVMLRYEDYLRATWDGWGFIAAQLGVIFIAVLARLASIGTKIMVEKDWIVVICGQNQDNLADMNTVVRTIDLVTNILAPVATGQLMAFASNFTAAVVIAAWNVVSMVVEYSLLYTVYTGVPALHSKSKSKTTSSSSGDETRNQAETDQVENRDDVEGAEECDITHNIGRDFPENAGQAQADSSEKTPPVGERDESSDVKKRSACQLVCRPCLDLGAGWRVYMSQPCVLAGLALACLYMTVLGFDLITTGYAYSQGVTEYVLGILTGAGSVIGILGTVSFRAIRKRVGLERTGLWGFSLEVLMLTLCVASVWSPGSPSQLLKQETPQPVNRSMLCPENINATTRPRRDITEFGFSSLVPYNRYHLVPIINPNKLIVKRESIVNYTHTWKEKTTTTIQPLMATTNSSDCDGAGEGEGSKSWISVSLLMAGIIAARYGLWMADLTVTQVLQEQVHESQRGVVSGVQHALNMFLDNIKFALVIAAPTPPLFGYLVLLSFGFVVLGGCLYAAYCRRIRGHIFHFRRGRSRAWFVGEHGEVDMFNGVIIKSHDTKLKTEYESGV